jgi:hypothetical protein
MLERMYVRCTQCGYDNSPEYRFCGMCGGPLGHPVTQTRAVVREVAASPVSEPVAASVSPPDPPSAPLRAEPTLAAPSGENKVHGPSFLGLSEDPKAEFSYLYEDEPARSHTGWIVIVLLLLVAGGLIGWQWRHNGFPFDRLTAGSSPAPAGSQSQNAPVSPAPDNSANGGAPSAASPNDSADHSPQSATQPTPGEGEKSAESSGPAAPSSAAAPAAAPPAAEEKAETAPPAKAHSVHAKLSPARSKAKAETTEVATATAAPSPDADLELAGERYLYGSGLPQNCTRAESSLRTAATHGNSKAQTVLGTMYATGHCVGRDLPAAYRWFARALREDPQNSRISADLQVLWRQMTPEEKQLATAKQ